MCAVWFKINTVSPVIVGKNVSSAKQFKAEKEPKRKKFKRLTTNFNTQP